MWIDLLKFIHVEGRQLDWVSTFELSKWKITAPRAPLIGLSFSFLHAPMPKVLTLIVTSLYTQSLTFCLCVSTQTYRYGHICSDFPLFIVAGPPPSPPPHPPHVSTFNYVATSTSDVIDWVSVGAVSAPINADMVSFAYMQNDISYPAVRSSHPYFKVQRGKRNKLMLCFWPSSLPQQLEKWNSQDVEDYNRLLETTYKCWN